MSSCRWIKVFSGSDHLEVATAGLGDSMNGYSADYERTHGKRLLQITVGLRRRCCPEMVEPVLGRFYQNKKISKLYQWNGPFSVFSDGRFDLNCISHRSFEYVCFGGLTSG